MISAEELALPGRVVRRRHHAARSGLPPRALTSSSSSGSIRACSTSRSPPIARTRCRSSGLRANSPRRTASLCGCRRSPTPVDAREPPGRSAGGLNRIARLLPLRRAAHRRRARRTGTGLDARSPRAGRPAPDQQPRRRFELRDARNRTAAALLRCAKRSAEGRLIVRERARRRKDRHARRRRRERSRRKRSSLPTRNERSVWPD